MTNEQRSKGGRTTATRYGAGYMRQIGQRGGQTTARIYGSDYMSLIGKRGAQTFYDRYQLVPVFQTQFAIIDKTTHKVVAIY